MVASSNALLSKMPESSDDDTPLASPSKMGGLAGAMTRELGAAGDAAATPETPLGQDADAQKVCIALEERFRVEWKQRAICGRTLRVVPRPTVCLLCSALLP